MKTLISKTLLLTVFLALSGWCLGQDTNGTGSNPMPEASVPAPQTAEISVTITEKGANCPPHGKIQNVWRWYKSGPPFDYYTVTGADVPYSVENGATTVKVVGKFFKPGYEDPREVALNIVPANHPEGHNGIIVPKPFNPVTLNPSPCNGGGGGWDIPNDITPDDDP
jgi:hypothetical protein